MTIKYEFLSAEWVAAVAEIVDGLLGDTDLTGVDFTVSEEVTNVPLERRHAGPMGWHLTIANSQVEVREGPAPGAEVRLVVDFEIHHDLATRPWRGNKSAIAESSAIRQRAASDGLLRVEGDFALAPAVVQDLVMQLHDPVAHITL